MLEEVVVDWQEVRGMWRVRQTFVAQFVQLLACRLCDVQSGVVGEKHRALPVDQCWLQAAAGVGASHQFAEHTSQIQWFHWDSESCSGSVSTLPNSDHDLFLVQVWLWEVLWSFFTVQPLSWSSPVII